MQGQGEDSLLLRASSDIRIGCPGNFAVRMRVEAYGEGCDVVVQSSAAVAEEVPVEPVQQFAGRRCCLLP